ncbi:MAG: lysophospholipase [Isosphaeraceae bacterium]
MWRIGAILFVAMVGAIGCRGVQTRDAVVRNGVRRQVDRLKSGLTFSKATQGVLARWHLGGIHPEASALQLEAVLQARPGTEPDGALALAELWYRVGSGCRRQDPQKALDAFRNAAAAAAIAVSDPRTDCLNVAVDLHNDAVANLLRLSNDARRREGASWNEMLAVAGILTTSGAPSVDPSRLTSVDVADDIHVRGMRNTYEGIGMGVPVVAFRTNDRKHPKTLDESFLPSNQHVGATVVAVPQGVLENGTWRSSPLTLVFHDPQQTRAVQAGSRTLKIGFDRTTPLAVQGSQSVLSAATFSGLFLSSFQKGLEPGLYSPQPYQRGKIPVVFSHGLSSNPAAFIQTFNDLNNDPAITARYQLLMFAYPTGRPIPTSAFTFRRVLYDAESKFGDDPAFHHMVLVGHSMGANLTRIMISESGLTLWNAVLNVPYDRLRASPETRKFLKDILIFHPVPFVRRAIFIAAPHRGSPVADEPLGRIVSRFISPPEEQGRLIAELTAGNGPDVIKAGIFRNRSINSIGSLSPSSPVLLALDRMPIAPEVHYHTIEFEFLGRLPTDLVVPSWSSYLAGSETHHVLPGVHISEQSTDTIAVLRSILLQAPNEGGAR